VLTEREASNRPRVDRSCARLAGESKINSAVSPQAEILRASGLAGLDFSLRSPKGDPLFSKGGVDTYHGGFALRERD
jgi:hypothetical protein